MDHKLTEALKLSCSSVTSMEVVAPAVVEEVEEGVEEVVEEACAKRKKRCRD